MLCRMLGRRCRTSDPCEHCKPRTDAYLAATSPVGRWGVERGCKDRRQQARDEEFVEVAHTIYYLGSEKISFVIIRAEFFLNDRAKHPPSLWNAQDCRIFSGKGYEHSLTSVSRLRLFSHPLHLYLKLQCLMTISALRWLLHPDILMMDRLLVKNTNRVGPSTSYNEFRDTSCIANLVSYWTCFFTYFVAHFSFVGAEPSRRVDTTLVEDQWNLLLLLSFARVLRIASFS